MNQFKVHTVDPDEAARFSEVYEAIVKRKGEMPATSARLITLLMENLRGPMAVTAATPGGAPLVAAVSVSLAELCAHLGRATGMTPDDLGALRKALGSDVDDLDKKS